MRRLQSSAWSTTPQRKGVPEVSIRIRWRRAPNTRGVIGLIALSLLVACGRQHDESEGIRTANVPKRGVQSAPGLQLESDEQAALGIELASVREATVANSVRGTAVALDGTALASTLADLTAARAELRSAQQAASRLQKLFDDDGNASRAALETARAQAAAARARVTTATARARLDWSSSLVDGTQSGKRLANIAAGREVLLRAEFPGTLPGPAAGLQYVLLRREGEPPLNAVAFIDRSYAPTASLAGTSVLLAIRVDPEQAPRPGERGLVVASAATTQMQPIVPLAAAIADGGRLWCYVRRGTDRFERIALRVDAPTPDGYPSDVPLSPGDQVVVRGAPLLLSRERDSGVAEASGD